MNVSAIFKDAFKFPVSNWKRLLIFGLITLSYTLFLGFNTYFGSNLYTLLMFIPTYAAMFLLTGYTLRTIKTSINEINEPPAFNKWIQMFLDGLKVIFTGILYFIIPGIVLIVGVFLSFDLSSGKFQFTNLSPIAMIVLLIGVLLLALFMFFYEIGLANMAYHNKFEAALNFGEIREVIRKIGWTKYLAFFVILILINVISGIMGFILGLIPIIGLIIIGFLIEPYFALIRARAIGLIYKEVL
jgi:hypothetical protein